MKNFKKIASAIAALSLAACVAVPMSATVFTASAADYTIKTSDTDKGSHTYAAYQIFTGNLATVDGKKVLTGIEWGSGVDAETEVNSEKLIDAVKKISLSKGDGESETPFASATTVADVAKILGEKAGDLKDAPIAKAFADVVAKYLDANGKISEKADSDDTLPINLAGYYLVQDESAPEKDDPEGANTGAYTRFVLQVLDPTTDTTLEIAAKQAAPTVDKQVLDNDTGTATDTTPTATESDKTGITGFWGETADHAINETFQFKLTAQLPNDDEINQYKAYTLKFHDTWSDGVTPNDTLNIKLYLGSSDKTGTEIPAKIGDGSTQSLYYEIDTTGKTLDVVIKDVKQITGFSSITTGLKNLEVSVTYDAHLNENATVSSNADDKNWTDNENTVDLEYSNNPNATGEGNPGTDAGKTPKDSVWVFTYEVDNKKVKETAEGEALADAEFKLYLANAEGNAASNTEVKLAYNDTKKYYYPIEDQTSGTGTTMTSDTDGLFNIHGLDEGTYFLVETQAPDGYNTAAPTKVVIDTTHAEETNGTHANKVTFESNTVGMDNTIIDNKGATLPSTGGIGTTLFYLGGGALVAVAGVMLITKKRMTKE